MVGFLNEGNCGAVWLIRQKLSLYIKQLPWLPHSIQFLLVIVYTNWKQFLIRFQQKYHAGSGYLAKGRNHIYVWQKFLQYSASKGISLGVYVLEPGGLRTASLYCPPSPPTHTHTHTHS